MRVAVLGAGYAGLTLARRLESLLPAGVDLVVVNDEPTHLVQHEVHRVVRRPSVADAIQVPLDDVLDWAEVVVDRVESVAVDENRVTLASGDTLTYDFAAVCLGAETAFYGIEGVEEHATPLKSVADAEAIRGTFKTLGDGDRVVVGGAGLSGIQVAGELAALADEDGVDVEVVLVEQLPSVAPNFPANFQRAVRRELEARGVTVRTDTTVTRATAETIEFEDGSMDYDQFVWTGGITGDEAMGGERPLVRSDLRQTGSTFVVGDAARVVDADGEAVPASASAALREARVVARNLASLVRHEQDAADDWEPRMKPYRFEVPGWIVSVGDGTVAQIGPTVLTGPAAKAMKATVGAGHLGSVGAMSQAVDLVEEELGMSLDALDDSESLPEHVDVEDLPAEVSEAVADAGSDPIDDEIDVDVAGARDEVDDGVEIAVTEEADETVDSEGDDGTAADDPQPDPEADGSETNSSEADSPEADGPTGSTDEA